MRRFLDWTAAQSSVSHSNQAKDTNRTSSSQLQSTLSSSLVSQQHPTTNTARDLELQHLVKLLHDIKYYQASSSPLPSAINSQNQKDFIDKINKTLPLFLNVFGSNVFHAFLAGSSTSFTLDNTVSTGLVGGRSASQSSLSAEEVREWSQSESCSSSKPSSPLPPRSPPMEKFPDILPFAFTIARLFVSEVRQRASDKHAEDASLAILQFLNAKQPAPNRDHGTAEKNEDSVMMSQKQALHLQLPAADLTFDQGWNLLLSLSTLAESQNSHIIQLLCDASLPSTLIKCLYLFYDLPINIKCKKVGTVQSAAKTDDAESADDVHPTYEFISIALVKAFTALLVQLCYYQSAIDELIRKDDLRLVLGIASSPCSAQNKCWRRTAFHALQAISKSMHNGFAYIEQNLCIQVYVDNLNRANSLGLAGMEDIIEMIKVLIEFVYNLDVNNRNQPRCMAPVIEQFKSSRITDLVEELLLRVDETISYDLNQTQTSNDGDSLTCTLSQQPSVCSEAGVQIDDYRTYGRRLIQTIIPLSKICYSQDAMTRNASLKPVASNRFKMLEQFRMSKPSARDCVLNNEALNIFKIAWSKCRDHHIIEAILDATISLFNDDKYNYFVFESEQLLVYYLSSPNFSRFPCKLKQKIFKFIEFIVIETNYIPCLELGTLGAFLTSKSTSNFDRTLVIRTLIACLRFSSIFCDIFREIGILEVIINLLNETMQNENLTQAPDNLEVLYLLLESSQYLLAGSNSLNCSQFNESGAARHVFNCLSKPKFYHIFIPPRSSSSDDGGPSSRNSTPTPTGISKPTAQRHLPLIQANHHLLDLNKCSQAKQSIKQMQKVAFTIIRQLILSSAGDEHLANLLGLLARNIDDLRKFESDDERNTDAENSGQGRLNLQSLIVQEVNLKIYILKSLMIVLKDSHRCRVLFRKVGGFVYIVSSLVALEKALPICDQLSESDLEYHNRWKLVNNRRIWRLIKNAIMTIVIAMRSEPTNIRAFCDDILPKFTESLNRLGCFRLGQSSRFQDIGGSTRSDNFNSYKSIFLSPPARDLSTVSNDNISPSEACCQILRFLYDMSLDMADGTSELEEQLNEDSGRIFHAHHVQHGQESKSLSFDQGSNEPAIYKRRSQLQRISARPPSLDLKACSPEPAILTFPGVILSILDLIPACPSQDLMIFGCLVVKSFFKHERNQQLLCEAGMTSKLLNSEWRITLTNRGHFLHNICEYMFEKLNKQAVTPRELKTFLRLGDPLCCKSLDDIDVGENVSSSDGVRVASNNSTIVKPSEKISTSRIETLVSMMADERDESQPPFIEFDMNGSGSSYIFMPSISPVNAKSLPQNLSYFLNSTLDVHTTEKNGILGGVGLSERPFPPVSGLTFSSWICVEQFPFRSSDPSHNIRLLTIYRGSAATGKEYSCLRIQISALDRALTVCTQEALLFDNENRSDNKTDPDCFVRVWTPETLFEGRWHHVVVSLSKSKQSKQRGVSLYIDGQLIHNQRISYLSNDVGPINFGPLGAGGNENACSPAAFVNAFIGSLPQIRLQTRTRWKQGPCHLIEEPLSPNLVSAIYALGPNHIGNFQGAYGLVECSKLKSTVSGPEHHKGALVHQSASLAQHSSSPKQGFPLTRVSSSGMSHQEVMHQHASSNGSNHNQQQFQINEERILISLDARSTSHMSLARMRKIYTRFDCRQVVRFLGLSTQENSTPLLLLHNTAVHLNGSSRGVGAMTIGYDHVRCFTPLPTEKTLFHIGGSYVLLGLVAQSQTTNALLISVKALVYALIANSKLQAQMGNINGYQILTMMLWRKKDLLDQNILKLLFALVMCDQKLCKVTATKGTQSKPIRQVTALKELICECFDLWLQTNIISPVLEFIHNLISSTPDDQSLVSEASTYSNSVRTKNLKCLRDLDLLPRMLSLLPQDPNALKSDELSNEDPQSVKMGASQSFDVKSIYLIKQTVFELLNRTPRQADILYFGQFLVSLLPTSTNERTEQTINLRNVLLKSLLQMMTRNKQKEVNRAMQEELVRILGFDWFMLFISGSYLDSETITLGFLNLMVLLSTDELYSAFKSDSATNGGWLKEPTFSTIDGKLNIQLLGVNVGIFLGLSSKGRTICHEVLKASNFCILGACLSNLRALPHIYLMIFQTMMSRLTQLDAAVLDPISSFTKLDLDSLCDCLIGETHHKRRQALTSIEFRCLELAVSITLMIGDIMKSYDGEISEEVENKSFRGKKQSSNGISERSEQNIPTEIARFFMYLYNNNLEFQNYCRRSEDLIEALSDALIIVDDSVEHKARLETDSNAEDCHPARLTQHPAAKEILELSRLIILDRMTETTATGDTNEFGTYRQLQTFERFMAALSTCKEAQVELVDMVLRQILLIIDSTSRHNSIKTIATSENIQQFQLLLINSILVSQIVADKLWFDEIFEGNFNQISNVIDHQLCLAEQIFKFNEILPKNNTPYAFVMQHTLNRVLLYALSRPMFHMYDKIFMLDLLKKIYDNRTIIILNHMHSPQSAEFFVCMTYCLLNIIEENITSPSKKTVDQKSIATDRPTSLIERQYGHPNRAPSVSDSQHSSTSLMLVSLARKVWDTIYQSKRGVLSEALDVPLSLPAFTLDTSLDLIQLKPDINESCERYWASLVESELKPKRRLTKQDDSISHGATTSAVNILSGRLTRVVNAASFVSRVVGATAGSMASNVNLVGERLTQTSRATNKPQRSPSDLTSGSISHRVQASSMNANPGLSPSPSGQSQSQQLTITQPSSQLECFKHQKLNTRQILNAFRTHISIIDECMRTQLSQKNHKLALHKYLCDEWLDLEFEMLLRERAVFGPEYGSKLDRWCLDLTEGPRRMRKKMVNNTRQFYQNYPYSPEQFNPSNKSLRYRPPMSFDSHLYYIKSLGMHKQLFVDAGSLEHSDRQKQDEGKTNMTEDGIEHDSNGNQTGKSTPTVQNGPGVAISSPELLTRKSHEHHSSSLESLSALRFQSNSPKAGYDGADQDDGDSTSFVDFSPEIEAETDSARESENIDSLSVLRLLEKNERISHMFRCSRVQGLDTYEGLLLFGREHFYLIDGFTLLKTREIKDIDSLPPEAHDPIIPNSTPNILAHSKKLCSKFSYDSVVEVHKRRYLLQPIALEIFSSDGRNTLIVFPRNIRNKVHSRLMAVATSITSNAQESLAGQKSNVSVEGGSGLLSNLIGETSVTQRWVRGELSNFQYLMNLNTIAGRSYNDLMQYPIFPWILADYTSAQLDFNNPSTFRDLSRPIGAQTSERLDQFKRRYSEWDDTETPPYHYGTFYSSAMIVAFYMVRMEPFTQHFLRLQGGHFDLADRMFHSINDSWLSASKHNMADIRELIPEFFYLPEFLKNENKYDLGIKQNGMRLDDVILPPWAKNDAREFIRLHRCALESDYVSAHLHEWIDLIFGYKQQGQAAVDAVNVFHHLFYEGNVDIYNTDIDPIKKNAVIGFINNFGQVPKQLFKKPHPMRKVTGNQCYSGSNPMPLSQLTAVSSASSGQRALTHCLQMLRQANTTFRDLRGPVGQIVQVDKNIVAVEQNKLLIPPEYCRYVAWGHADQSLRMGLYESEKPIFVWEGSDNLAPYEILCCTIPNNRTMITAGTDSLITVWKIEKMRSFSPVTNLYGHVEPITCLASSQAYSLIVSGSRDRTAIIWDLNRLTFVRQLGCTKKMLHRGPISAISINDSTGDIATCAASWLHLWSINGVLLAQVDTALVIAQHSMMDSGANVPVNMSQLHVLSVCFSQYNEWDLNEVILTGSSDGSVAFWSMRYYQSPMSQEEVAEATRKEADRFVDVSTDAAPSEVDRQRVLATKELGESESFEVEVPGEQTPDVDQRKRATHTSSDPIEIARAPRQRTDTMNSEWVKLSASSTSTMDTSPMLRATPTSPNEFQLSSSIASGESLLASAHRSTPREGLHEFGSLEHPSVTCERSEVGESSPSCTVYEADVNQQLEQTGESKVSLSGAKSTTQSEGRKNDEQEGQTVSKGNVFLQPNDPSQIKFSKSDTSLVDSFVLLGDASPRQQYNVKSTSSPNRDDGAIPTSAHQSRPKSSVDYSEHSELQISTKTQRCTEHPTTGRHTTELSSRTSPKLQHDHCWRRELYLRGILPRRQGKTLPPAVTCLTLSKNHKNLYVGDACGKIACWTIN